MNNASKGRCVTITPSDKPLIFNKVCILDRWTVSKSVSKSPPKNHRRYLGNANTSLNFTPGICSTQANMRANHRLFIRGETYYIEDCKTRKQKSLHTTDRTEAERLLAAKNETANKNQLALAVGQVYLSAVDPALLTRTWADAMKIMIQRGGSETQKRTRRALEHHAFDRIRNKVIHETTGTDFLTVLDDKKRSTLHCLKMLQSLAVNLGWLVGRVILPKANWRTARDPEADWRRDATVAKPADRRLSTRLRP